MRRYTGEPIADRLEMGLKAAPNPAPALRKTVLLFSQDTACQSHGSFVVSSQGTGHPEICRKTTAFLALPCFLKSKTSNLRIGLFSLSKRSCVHPKRIYTLRDHEKDQTTVRSSTKPLAKHCCSQRSDRAFVLLTRHASPVLSQSKAQLSATARSKND